MPVNALTGKDYLSTLFAKDSLTEEQSQDCLTRIFSGEFEETQITSLLRLLREKGESVDEVVGFAKAMRSHMAKVFLPGQCIDLCGTGGSGKNRFNVSTAAAFVLATLGELVAKHGNRGSSKPNGSFDFLEKLGVAFEDNASRLTDLYAKTGMAFLFARNHHSAMRYVAPSRKALGGRTIFNLLGPLCNPASVRYQVIGTTSEPIAMLIAEAIQRLSVKKALIIVGGDGYDELSITKPSKILEVTQDNILRSSFDPGFIGASDQKAVAFGGTATENASLFVDIMATGNTDHFVAKKIAVNVGAALYCLGRVSSIQEGYDRAMVIIASKKVWNKLDKYKQLA
ncbi:MAG: anthranilate phosphoribosyltransferase [Candidatus Marinamargulisbacteria bacterium]|jgi:anthranilate phosphoribosyltransferase